MREREIRGKRKGGRKRKRQIKRKDTERIIKSLMIMVIVINALEVSKYNDRLCMDYMY